MKIRDGFVTNSSSSSFILSKDSNINSLYEAACKYVSIHNRGYDLMQKILPVLKAANLANKHNSMWGVYYYFNEDKFTPEIKAYLEDSIKESGLNLSLYDLDRLPLEKLDDPNPDDFKPDTYEYQLSNHTIIDFEKVPDSYFKDHEYDICEIITWYAFENKDTDIEDAIESVVSKYNAHSPTIEDVLAGVEDVSDIDPDLLARADYPDILNLLETHPESFRELIAIFGRFIYFDDCECFDVAVVRGLEEISRFSCNHMG